MKKTMFSAVFILLTGIMPCDAQRPSIFHTADSIEFIAFDTAITEKEEIDLEEVQLIDSAINQAQEIAFSEAHKSAFDPSIYLSRS